MDRFPFSSELPLVDRLTFAVSWKRDHGSCDCFAAVRLFVSVCLQFTEETYGTLPDATVTWEVYDRVIYAQEGGVVPTGLRGTVIAIGASGPKGGSYLTVLFDESFAAGDHASKILEVPAITLLNLTYGTRKQQENERTFGTRYFLRTQVVA